MNYSTILLAAGKGSRTNLEYNKVFYTFSDGMCVLEKSMSFFLKDEDCKQIILVCAEYEKDEVEKNIGLILELKLLRVEKLDKKVYIMVYEL